VNKNQHNNQSNTIVSIVAAVASNGVIGHHNALPWRLPEDLQFFKNTTTGAPIMMGRNTFESIGRALPGRLNVVITRKSDWIKTLAPSEDVKVYANEATGQCIGSQWLAERGTAIMQCNNPQDALACLSGIPHVFVIGGSQLYQSTLALANELILTELQYAPEGDTFFPRWPRDQFTETWRERHGADGQRAWGYDFVRYTRT
jgi:dihydrofolate reductase